MNLVEGWDKVLMINLIMYLHLHRDHNEWNGFAAGYDEVVDGFLQVLGLTIGHDDTHFVVHVVIKGFVVDEFYDFRVVGWSGKL